MEREMRKNLANLYFADEGNAEDINLMDLPNEIIENSLFPCLGRNELNKLRLMNLRLKEISESVIKKRCKYTNDISFYFSRISQNCDQIFDQCLNFWSITSY